MPLSDGLVGHWTFDERDVVGDQVANRTAYDAPATLNGNAPYEPDTPVGGGRQMTAPEDRTGRDGYLSRVRSNYPQIDSINYQTPSTFTTWFRYDAPSRRWNSGSFMGNPAINILAKGTTANSIGLTLQQNSSLADSSDQNTEITLDDFRFIARARPGSGPALEPVQAGYGPEDLGRWFHLAAVYEPAGTMTLYIDGVERGSESDSINDFYSTTQIDSNFSTTRGNWAPQFFTLSDARVYTRAISPSEVRRLSNMRSPDRITANPNGESGSLRINADHGNTEI